LLLGVAEAETVGVTEGDTPTDMEIEGVTEAVLDSEIEGVTEEVTEAVTLGDTDNSVHVNPVKPPGFCWLLLPLPSSNSSVDS
jgi:hypothetical protein